MYRGCRKITLDAGLYLIGCRWGKNVTLSVYRYVRFLGLSVFPSLILDFIITAYIVALVTHSQLTNSHWMPGTRIRDLFRLQQATKFTSGSVSTILARLSLYNIRAQKLMEPVPMKVNDAFGYRVWSSSYGAVHVNYLDQVLPLKFSASPPLTFM